MKLSQKELEKIGFPYILEHIPVQSPLGEAQKRALAPCTSLEEAEEALSLTDWVRAKRQHPAMNALLQELMLIKDVGGSIEHLLGGELTLQELFALKGFALRLLGVSQALEALPPVPKALQIDACLEVLEILDPDGTRTPAFALREGWSERLAYVREQKREIEKRIAAAFGEEKEALLVKRTDIVDQEEEEERRMRRNITAALRPYKQRLETQRQILGKLDLVLGKAAMAEALHAVRPFLGEDKLEVHGIRAPHLEEKLREQGRAFTPLHMELSRGVCALTGANMGGKSVALRTLALAVYMGHCGLYVCGEEAKMPFFAGLCMVGGDLEDTRQGLSSFGGELMGAQQAAKEAEEGLCLCLFDEFARGTNPLEGARIQRGTAAYFRKLGAYSVFVTHYDGVSELADVCYRTKGLQSLPKTLPASSQKDRLSLLQKYMDYGLEPVSKTDPVPKEALRVAELMGLEPPLLDTIRKQYPKS